MSTLEEFYRKRLQTEWNINEHLPVLRDYASRCDIVTELGVDRGFSTIAFLAAQPTLLTSVDIVRHEDLSLFASLSEVHDYFDLGNQSFRLMVGKTQWQFLRTDDLCLALNPCDLLFIDTNHTCWQLRTELRLHSRHVAKWIILHDTEVFGLTGMDGSQPGMSAALSEFIDQGEFGIKQHFQNQAGLTILERT